MEKRQKRGERELSILLESLAGNSDRQLVKQRLAASFEDLRADAGQKKDEVSRIVAARLLTSFWIRLDDQVSLAFDNRNYAIAALQLEAMALVRPDNPQVFYHLARANSLLGRKKEALEALNKAVDKGYPDAGTLEKNHEFDALRNSAEFSKIIGELKKR